MNDLDREPPSPTSKTTDLSPKKRALVFEFFDYRQFLGAYFQLRKQANPNFSHRVFAREAKLGSPSYLLMVMRGERNLSAKTLKSFVEALKLTGREREYFELLVEYDHTTDLSEKSRYFSDLLKLRAKGIRSHDLERDRFEFLSKWYVVAIYVLLGVPGFKADPHWIAARLRKKISPAQADDALERLKRLGMIANSEERWIQTTGSITVKDDTRTMAVAQYHEAMLRLAYEALRILPLSEREMNGVTISIPTSQLAELKEKIRMFRKEINAWASDFQNPNQVVQLNIQLFPLTDIIRTESNGSLTET